MMKVMKVMQVMKLPVDDSLQPGVDVGCPLGPLGGVAVDTLGDDGLDIPGEEVTEDIPEDSSTLEVVDKEDILEDSLVVVGVEVEELSGPKGVLEGVLVGAEVVVHLARAGQGLG